MRHNVGFNDVSRDVMHQELNQDNDEGVEET